MTTAQAYREVCTALGDATLERATASMPAPNFSVPRKLWLLLAHVYGIRDSEQQYSNLLESLLQVQPDLQVFLTRLYWTTRVEIQLSDEIESESLTESLMHQFGFDHAFALTLLGDVYRKVRNACYTPEMLDRVQQLYSAYDLCRMLRDHFVSPYGYKLTKHATPILKEIMGSVETMLKETLGTHLESHFAEHSAAAETDDSDDSSDDDDEQEEEVEVTTPQLQHIQIDIQDYLQDPSQALALWQVLRDAFSGQHTDPAHHQQT